ncbi:MAG: phosphoethanolamine transferase [Flaviramulus sp.]|nr:phosphoethanolamine transferase [Flaviramulus sp.]
MKFTALLYWNFPYVVLKSGIQYQNQLKVFDDFGKRNINLNANLVTDNDLIVIIIGESTTRNHMGIYGYRRNTTPKLEELSDSLFIYNNVISSHVFTTASLYDAFTITKSNQTTFLIDYIKKAGYKVYWLSNQRPIGFHDNLVSRIASAANESIFLSYNDFRHKTFYDEVLFPMIDEKLLIKEKKVVFVHLIGTHYDYSKRYPEKFNVFKSKKQDKKNKIIDTYDNSILYNDLIVSEIIKKVKLKNEKSAVLYFSDHGEEVYDVVDYFGHFADKPTSTMYEIPFLLYKASSFEEPNNFIIDENRSFMLDDLPESLIHLMGIESESIDNSKSIFSLDFKNEMRLIDNGLDFESFKFKENK